MRLVLKFTEGEMSEEKRIKLSFSNQEFNFPGNSGNEEVITFANQSSPNPKEDVSDWREKAGSVKDRNLVALKNSSFTDITLEVGPEKTQIPAHKLILALGSRVFEAMFYGPLAEKGDKVVIPDIMSDGFQVLLKYLYGDVAIMSNEVEALNAWIAAEKYCVPNLKKECEKFFCKCPIASSNIWSLLENAIFLDIYPLVKRCKLYLERHAESSFCAEGFLETKTETVKEVLNLSSSNASEIFLLKSITHWGRHKVNAEEAASLQDALRPLLPHIRFSVLTPEEFCLFIDETNDLLEKSDALAILKHLVQPLKYSLPEWCCDKNWIRTPLTHTNIQYSSKCLDGSKKFKKASKSLSNPYFRKR